MSSYCFNKQKRKKKHKNIVYLSSTLSTQKKKNKMADFISKVHLITTRQHLEKPSFYLIRLEPLPIYESLTSFQLSVITDSRKKQIKTKTFTPKITQSKTKPSNSAFDCSVELTEYV